MSLNQSNIIFGINFSVADLFCILILIYLANKELIFPFAPTIFYIVLSAILLGCTIFYLPYKLLYYPEASDIFINYAKLCLSFMYFIIGFNINEEKLLLQVIKWYSITGTLIGILGCLFITFSFKLSEFMFLDFRFKGLMNDPNFFSIIQVSSIVYFSRVKTINILFRWLALFLLFISIIASASKTGILSLFIYILFRIIEAFLKEFNISLLSKAIVLNILVLCFISVSTFVENIFVLLTSNIPSLSRIQYLLTDFTGAISGSGSGRDLTWKVGIEIFNLSPIIGVGLGTYSGVALKLFGTNSIAHNTYLQLLAEWGVFLSLILFIYIALLMLRVTFVKKLHTESNYILRDILLIFSIGSFSISLNNARMIWFFLGVFVFHTVFKKLGVKKDNRKKEKRCI